MPAAFAGSVAVAAYAQGMAAALPRGAWISAGELLEVARSLAPWCTDSTPRWLRRKRLLPEPVRSRGQYWYPASAAELLRADTHWRERGVRDVEARRLLLWVQGFPLRLGDVRPILAQFVDGWVASTELLTGRLSADGTAPRSDESAGDLPGVLLHLGTAEAMDSGNVIAAVEAAAAAVVSKRSLSPLPEPMRKRRMTRREKEQAVTFALLSLLHLAGAAAERAEGAAALDRMMGLDRRRKSVKPFLTTEDPLALARAADPERMRRGAEASADELELARRFLRLGLELGPAFVALMAVDLGPSVEEMYAMLCETPAATIGPVVAFGITSLAGGFHDHREEVDVGQMLRDLDVPTVACELYESLEKPSERLAFRQALPPAARCVLEERLGREAQKVPHE